MNPRALFLLIAYSNMNEVDDFVDHVRAVFPPGEVAFSICDNSPTASPSRHEGNLDVVTAIRRDNPGYLDGGLEALERYRIQKRVIPEWVFLANTDIRFESRSVVEHLAAAYGPEEPVILAPRITEGDARIEKNPHVVNRRSQRRLLANRAFTANSLLALTYLWLSVMRRRLSLTVPLSARRSAPPLTATLGSPMYSPYGALIIFSQAFFEYCSLPSGVPLLAEEYAIAEAAVRHQVPVLFEPRVHVHHTPHTTTGPDITWRRARMLTSAFRYIADSARAVPADG